VFQTEAPRISSWTSSEFDVAESKTYRPVSDSQLPKLDVAGSIPVSRSWFQEVSAPAIPAISINFQVANYGRR
jgi:hypothetical protein